MRPQRSQIPTATSHRPLGVSRTSQSALANPTPPGKRPLGLSRTSQSAPADPSFQGKRPLGISRTSQSAPANPALRKKQAFQNIRDSAGPGPQLVDMMNSASLEDITPDDLKSIDFTGKDEETVKTTILKAYGLSDCPPSPAFFISVMEHLPTFKHLVPTEDAPAAYQWLCNSEIVMSGAVHPEDTISEHGVKRCGDERVGLPYGENSLTVCALDPELMAKHMPYSIISRNNLDALKTKLFDDVATIHHIPEDCHTTALGLRKAMLKSRMYSIGKDNQFLSALNEVSGRPPPMTDVKIPFFAEDLKPYVQEAQMNFDWEYWSAVRSQKQVWDILRRWDEARGNEIRE